MQFKKPHLTHCQEKAYEALTLTNDNIFLTGVAGSGKSFLIKEFYKKLNLKEFPILASTGAAAVLIGGRTFHSFFGLGIMQGGLEGTIERVLRKRNVLNRIKRIKGFILDEVSMIDKQAFEAAYIISQYARSNHQSPWGGLRVIAVGDFFQLPPVSQKGEKPWVFNSPYWNRSQFQSQKLSTVIRSEDHEYTTILNQIRMGHITQDVQNFLDRHTDENYHDPLKTHLFSRRSHVNQFNESRLNEIPEDEIEFPTLYVGSTMAIEQIKKQAPIPETLKLKRGALVMIRVNDPQYRFVNGSVGQIIDMDKNTLTIELKKKGRIVDLEKTKFSLLDGDGNEIAVAENFPINLAYATTIHKSQGATLDDIVCDLRNLWEPGQAYVALSRLRSAQGLQLLGWDTDSIFCDEQVEAFYEKL